MALVTWAHGHPLTPESRNHCHSRQGQSYSAHRSPCDTVVAIQEGLCEENIPVYVE